MGEVTCTVTGLDELERLLTQLAPKAAKTALRRATKQGAEIFREAIEENAPRGTGKLADNINIVSRAGAGDDSTTGSITVSVGPGKDTFYGKFQEFGTVHQAAQPFMRPAFEQNREQVLETFRTALKEEIEGLKNA